MAYTTIDKPSDYFNTKIYAPDGSSSFAVTGVGFQPDWVWLKSRNYAEDHQLNDSVRGATKGLQSNSARTETSQSNGLTAFGSDGFTVGNLSDYNYNGDSIVSWNWKAGTAFTNDASSTGIGSIDSAGSVNTDAGFSIVSYTGTENLQTVKHGLSTVPSMILFKNRSASANWKVYHKSLGATKGLKLDSSDAVFTSAGNFNNTEPTSSVFTVNTDAGLNGSGNSIISYCFSDVKGYQKSGSFIGNGNANGSYTHLGFSPAFLFLKNTADSGGNWQLFDNKRDPNNVANHRLFPSLNNAESTDADNNIDFLSNGFKMRTSNGDTNSNGVTFIYYAVASSPFVTSTGIPTTAR